MQSPDKSANRDEKGRRALGRGLEALLPSGGPSRLQEVDVARVDPNPSQPRQRFDHESLEELAASMREHGVLQPLVVTPSGDDRFQVIVGERRLHAAKLAELKRVPVIVKDVSDRETLELALIENVQRADLNPLEEATAYERLIQDFGLTQQEVAQQVGKSRVAVANTLRLQALPGELKRAVVDGRLTEGHARALLAVPDQQSQLAIFREVEQKGLSVRQTEELVRGLQEARPESSRKGARSADVEAIEDELRRALGTKVLLRPGKRGGRIVIEYYSDEDFRGLYERLTGPD